jgi:Asp-tRNA(Asn)/Glu-tRNA(Gln) amidotransferase A subunit family amidase
VWDEEPGWPLAAEVKAGVHRAADAAARAGAHVEHAKPKIDGGALMQAYMTLLSFVLFAQAGDIDGAEKQRSEMKQRLAEFFADSWDAILMPISIVPPFKHQQEPAFQERILDVDGTPTPYGLMLNWIAPATALHAPAIAVQAGHTVSGLPVGVQFVGPWNGEDRLFDFAAAVEDGLGGFKPPKI